jgi:hypothetical protein
VSTCGSVQIINVNEYIPELHVQCLKLIEIQQICIGYFEATRGYACDLFTEARSAEVNKHISPRYLKITYLIFTLRGRVNESE